MIDLVWVVNGLLAVITTMIGVIMGNLWMEIKALRVAKHAHTTEIAALKILVVGDYVKRDELREIMKEVTTEVRTGMKHIEHKMDSGFSELYDELKNKADKH